MDAWKTGPFPFWDGQLPIFQCRGESGGLRYHHNCWATPRHEEIVKSSQELTVGPAMPVTSTSRSTNVTGKELEGF